MPGYFRIGGTGMIPFYYVLILLRIHTPLPFRLALCFYIHIGVLRFGLGLSAQEFLIPCYTRQIVNIPVVPILSSNAFPNLVIVDLDLTL